STEERWCSRPPDGAVARSRFAPSCERRGGWDRKGCGTGRRRTHPATDRPTRRGFVRRARTGATEVNGVGNRRSPVFGKGPAKRRHRTEAAGRGHTAGTPPGRALASDAGDAGATADARVGRL